jgi:hypothetical protein
MYVCMSVCCVFNSLHWLIIVWIDWSKLAANDPYGQFWENAQSSSPAPSSELKTLLQLAASGSARAQWTIGRAYAIGHGVPVDQIRARQWLKYAAKQGHAGAQFHLGQLEEKQLPYSCDDKGRYLYFPTGCTTTAVKWYDEAIKQNHPAAIWWRSFHSLKATADVKFDPPYTLTCMLQASAAGFDEFHNLNQLNFARHAAREWNDTPAQRLARSDLRPVSVIPPLGQCRKINGPIQECRVYIATRRPRYRWKCCQSKAAQPIHHTTESMISPMYLRCVYDFIWSKLSYQYGTATY